MVKRPTEKPGATLKRVRVPGAAIRDILPDSNFSADLVTVSARPPCAGMVCGKYNMTILFVSFYVYIIVAVVESVVCTIVGEIRRYRNDRCSEIFTIIIIIEIAVFRILECSKLFTE